MNPNIFLEPFCFSLLTALGCGGQSQGKNAEIVPVYLVKLRYRQGIDAHARLYGKSGAVVLEYKPVLVAGVA